MKNLLDAIKEHPQCFIDTLLARAQTTPSEENRHNHNFLAIFIRVNAWGDVSDMIQKQNYSKPLSGVVYCLSRYSDIEDDVWCKVVDLFEEGKLV